MEHKSSYLTVSLNLGEYIEVDDFVDFFASLSAQYENYVRDNHSSLPPDSKLYIKEIRKGSITADIFPSVPDLVGLMDDDLVVAGFAAQLKKTIRGYIRGARHSGASKSDLKDFLGTIESLAKDKDGSALIETVLYKKGSPTRKVALKFSSKEARRARENIESHKADLDKEESADYQRVLMVFKRSDVDDARLGQRTGERVMIEDLLERDLPLIYASDLAEQQIKHEIRNSDSNVYKKGFIVDVNVQMKGGKIVAYRVTNRHQVIDLSDEDDDGWSAPGY